MSTIFRFFQKLDTLHKYLLLYIGIGAVLFTFIIPPFQKPDEIVQYYKTISLANGNLTCRMHNNRLSSNIPSYLYSFPNDLQSETILGNPKTKIPTANYLNLLTKNKFDSTPVAEYASCHVNSFFFLVPSILLYIPVKLSMNPFFIFYLGRLVFAIIGLSILFLSLVIVPVQLRLIPLFIFSLPMVLNQISSYNKDVYHLSFGMLFFSALFALWKKKRTNVLLYYFIVGISLVICISSRFQYAPLILLLFTLQWKVNINKKWIMLVVPVVIAAYSLVVYIGNSHSLFFDSYLKYVYPTLQIRFMIQNPRFVSNVILNTLTQDFDFYTKGMVGILGWLDTYLHPLVYFTYLGFFFFIIYSVRSEFIQTKVRDVWLLICSVCLVFLVVCLSFYVFWNPVGSEHIAGIQGRYFILLIPCIIWLSSYVLNNARRFLPLVLISILISVGIFIYDRYYNFSEFYYRDEVTSMHTQIYENEIKEAGYFTISVDKTKKTTGISLLPGENSKLYTPYLVTFLDSNCEKSYGQKVIDVSKIKSGEYYDINFHLKKDGINTYCVGIEPYGEKVYYGNPLRLKTDDTGMADIRPLYLY